MSETVNHYTSYPGKNMNKMYPLRSSKSYKLSIIFLLALFVLGAGTLKAQVSWTKQTLKRGKLWATVWNSLQYGDPTEPVNAYHTLDYPGYSKGTDISDVLNYAGAVGYAIYGKRNNLEHAYSLDSRYFPSGEDVFAIEEALLTKNYNLKDMQTPGEEIVTGAHHLYNLAVDIRRTSRVWSYPEYDDFIIHEVEITNKRFSNITDLYFGMRYSLYMTIRSGTQGDEKYGWDEENKLFYFYDHRSFNWEDETPIEFNFGVGPERGDIGDARDIDEPNSMEHELDAPGYFTAIVLDSAGGNIYQNILEYGSKSGETGAPVEDRIFIHTVDEPARFKTVMTHQQPRMSWDEARAAGGEGGNKYERSPIYLVSVGPFSLAPYETVKIVYAEVMGEMDREKIVEGGVENIDLMATASRDSMLKNVKAAKQLYQQNLIPPKHPPMTPTNGENSLTLTPEKGFIRVEWPPIPDSYKDPVTGVNDFAGYRVYRSTYFTIGPWELIADIPKDSVNVVNGYVQFEDHGISGAVGVYYTVTSYDFDGNESGKVNNNRFPVYPFIADNENFPKDVYVVPNPFKQHSGLTGQGERYRIDFIGLPGKARIKIYTMAGDLIKTIHHDDGSGSAAWGSVTNLDYQLTDWALTVAPGVYVYLVESLVAGHSGETYIGKFAIIK
ncbi:hypothetical protein FMIA91_17330 [Fidelibacter multiformis]